MERLFLPLFAVFGFLGSLFFEPAGPGVMDKITQTGKAEAEYD